MNDSIIQVQDVHIYRRELPILADLNFSIQAGEFCYLVGKTGAGKSSLLHTLFGMEPIKQGSIWVNGFALHQLNKNKLPKYRRTLGMIFQDFRLFEDQTINDNLDTILKATGWNKKARQPKINELLEWVHLQEKRQAYPYELSGGEKQRVAIARAIANNPPLIIGDEPTGNLDPATSDEIMFLLRRINREQNTAMLIATHDYRLLDKFPGRIFKIEKGTLIELKEL